VSVALHVVVLVLLIVNMITLLRTSAKPAATALDYGCITGLNQTVANTISTTAAHGDDVTDASTKNRIPSHNATKPPRLRIALLASFVAEPQRDGTMGKFTMHQNIINKACYAKIWDYDFIFYLKDMFNEEDKEKAPWLNFAGWNRVPQIQAILDDYDWVLYGDLDHTFRDLSRPLESFLNEFELYNHHPSVFLPNDAMPNFFTFSTYAMLLKNDAFGHKLLKNWMKFGRGMCPNGNIPMKFLAKGRPKYSWEHSDQPGLWYALVRTYQDFHNTGKIPQVCNKETGYIATERAFGPETNIYFRELGTALGHDRLPLLKMRKNQEIIWSTDIGREASHDWGGLGLQMNWGRHVDEQMRNRAFALHQKKDMDEDYLDELRMCKENHGCFSEYNKEGKLEVGCNGRSFTVVQ